MEHSSTLTGFPSVRHGVLFRNPQPHVRSIHAYFPSVVAFDRMNLGATVVLGEAFEAPNLHVVYFESSDGGETWNRKSTLTNPATDLSSSTVGRLSLLPDGCLVAIVTRHHRSANDEGLTDGATIGMKPMQIELYRSLDRGANWQGPELISPPFAHTAFEMCSGLTVLGDGSYAWPTSTWPISGQAITPDKFRTGAMVSHDQGKTWPDWMPAFRNDQNIYWESKLLQLDDQRLLAVAWAHDLEKGIDYPNHYAIGTADGESWGAPQSTDILGQTLSSVPLPDGKILSVYRRMDEPGLWATLSSLKNDRWENHEHHLLWRGAVSTKGADNIRDEFASLKFGAPAILRLLDESIYIAFWAVVDGVSQISTITLRPSTVNCTNGNGRTLDARFAETSAQHQAEGTPTTVSEARAEPSTSWKSVLELNSQCARTAGSETALRNAIQRGADLRIYTGFRHNEHLDTDSPNGELIDEVSDFRTTYLIEDRWAGGIMTLRMPIDPPQGFGPRPSMSFFLYNENGQQAIARPYFDGAAPNGEPGASELADYSRMPKYREFSRWDDHTNAPSSNFCYAFERFRFFTKSTWREAYAHEADGTPRTGSFDTLVRAFNEGCEIKVGVENLCEDLGSRPHTVFVPCGPGYSHTESRVFSCGSQPVVRVAPNVPLIYESRNWDFGWLFLRTDGFVEYWRCDPYKLTFSKIQKQLAIRWFVR
jgi:hypothetical protein